MVVLKLMLYWVGTPPVVVTWTGAAGANVHDLPTAPPVLHTERTCG